MAKFVFGPVPSRRLGFSLGVDIIPAKHCCFDCIYCQIGRTTNNELVRRSFHDPYVVVEEIVEEIGRMKGIDYISFSGSGEPTLNADLGIMIQKTKEAVEVPVAVITNGALLFREDVRADLMHADVVLPSLDAVSEDMFRYIDRPHSSLDVETIIGGLKLFRKEYPGKIWLEIMFIKGINDDEEELRKFREIIAELNVDKVQVNTVTRPPPAEDAAGALTRAELTDICSFMGAPWEIICSFEKSQKTGRDADWFRQIPEILKRRSMTLDDIVRISGASFFEAKEQLQILESEGQIRRYVFEDSVFYMKV